MVMVVAKETEGEGAETATVTGNEQGMVCDVLGRSRVSQGAMVRGSGDSG